MGSEWFSCARSSKQPSNYLSRISYSRIRGQVTIGFHAFFLQRNNFHRMVSVGHSLILALCACHVCVCVHVWICAHTHDGVYAHSSLCGRDCSSVWWCVKEIVRFHFPHITLHDFPHLCSHPRQLSPTLLRFPGHLAFPCLLKGILSPYSGLNT